MFDIGFSELVLIFIVGLIVLGPTRLPMAIRTVMGWVGAIKRLATNVQNEISEELRLQELKESIKKAEELNLKNLAPDLTDTIDDLKVAAQDLEESIKNKDKYKSSESELKEKQQGIENDS